MALFDDASLVTTPNGYKAGTLYSIKPTSGAGDMTVVRATTATRVNSAGLIESVANNVPRLDYTDSTCPSLLVEPQRSNLVLYSEQFNNAFWNQAASGSATFTVTANQTTAPNGTNTADLISITRSATSELSAIYTNVGQGLGTFKNSIYLKAKDNSNVGKTIDLWSWEGGTRGYTMITLTADWVRYEQDTTVFSVSGAELFDFGLLPISYSTSTTLAVEFYIWGAQAEAGDYATSYIPTTSAAVTRNADVISKTGISSLIGQTEGVIFIDYNYDAKPDTNGNIPMVIYDGSNEAYIFITSGGSVRLELYDGGVLQCLLTTSIGAVGRKKIAFGYKQNDFVGYMNGVQIANDTSGTVGAMSNLYVGSYYTANYNANGGINSSILFPTRLTNAELAQLTTI